MKSDFIPKRDGDLNAYEENFTSKLAIYGPELEIDPNEITESINVLNQHKTAFATMVSKRLESRSAREENLQNKKIAKDEIRRMARKVKSCKKYTPAIGEGLGIIGPDIAPIEMSVLKPILIAKINGTEVVIKFRKEGTEGVKIYSRRSSETEFTFLAFDTSSPYTDRREKLNPTGPEQREYYAFFFDDGIHVGKQSDIIKVIIP